jgi:hypothetical protein
LLDEACRTEWVVYAKPPYERPEHVLAYLARYTHRIAISNRRILQVDDRVVTFRFKDYRGRRARSITLSLEEFARRFLLPVLPKGFVRIRYYGFLANGCRTRLLTACCRALDQLNETAVEADVADRDDGAQLYDLLPRPSRLCPNCGKGQLRCIEILARPPPSPWHALHVAA